MFGVLSVAVMLNSTQGLNLAQMTTITKYEKDTQNKFFHQKPGQKINLKEYLEFKKILMLEAAFFSAPFYKKICAYSQIIFF